MTPRARRRSIILAVALVAVVVVALLLLAGHAYKTLVENSPGFFWPGVDDETMKQAYACSPSRCATLINAVWLESTMAAVATHPPSGLFRQLAQNSSCDTAMLQLARETPAMTAEQARRLIFTGPTPLEELFR